MPRRRRSRRARLLRPTARNTLRSFLLRPQNRARTCAWRVQADDETVTKERRDRSRYLGSRLQHDNAVMLNVVPFVAAEQRG